jgi:uncharacterized protein (UPF0332 family)
LNPDHLLDQAERLLTPTRPGFRRQADLKRAISTAYYALFHSVLRAVADEFVGARQRRSARYALVYRSIDHRTLRELAAEARKQQASNRYEPYVPKGGFEPGLVEFSQAVRDLRDKRHAADYDPAARFKPSDAERAITTARDAMRLLREASEEQRKMYLSLLLCPPRQG